VNGFERIAEVVIAGWLLFNGLGMALVTVGIMRQYARAAPRERESAGEVPFERALPLTE